MRYRKMIVYRSEGGARYGLLWVVTGEILPISVLLRPMLVDGYTIRKCNRKTLYILEAGVMKLCSETGKLQHLVEVCKRDMAIGQRFCPIGSRYGMRSAASKFRGYMMRV